MQHGGRYEGSLSVFRLFEPAKIAAEADAIDQIILEDYIIDILYFFHTDHKAATKFLLTGLPTRANYDHLLIEVRTCMPVVENADPTSFIQTLFGQMFLLPRPPFKPVYYSVVLADLCKTSASIPPVVGSLSPLTCACVCVWNKY